MRKISAVVIAAAALAYSPAASAADFFPGDPEFTVSGNPFTGTDPVSGAISQVGLDGSDVHNYIFQIGPVTGDAIGLGSGSVITSFSVTGGTSLLFNSVTFNNGITTYIVPISALGVGSAATLSNIPIYSGNVNTLSVDYTATGEASYGGQLTFIPGGIPEPATWAMMLIGFAAVGFALRRRRRDDNVRVRYAF